MTDLAPQFTLHDIDRRLPAGDEIFLDHIAHFVRDAGQASRALAHAGFAPTPISVQMHPDASGGMRPIGTANTTIMFARGYVEILFKTSDTPLTREFDSALARYAGLHLVAFAVADVAKAHAHIVRDDFHVRPLEHTQREVESESGRQLASFTIARAEPRTMPEGCVQMLTHHTEKVVWQKPWLLHPNSAIGLIDLVIAVADVADATRRFSQFTSRTAFPIPGGAFLHLDRGGVFLATHDAVTGFLPEIAIPTLPFIAAYAVHVESLAAVEAVIDSANLEWRAFEEGIVASFPAELGEGAWLFVENVSALPWRR